MTPEQESRLHELAMDYRCAHVASASPRWKDVYAYVDSLIAAERPKIEVGERVFEFKSMDDWVNHAQRIWKLHRVSSRDTVCVDQKGRIIIDGGGFRVAQEDSAYPVVVYMARADTPKPIVDREYVEALVDELIDAECGDSSAVLNGSAQ